MRHAFNTDLAEKYGIEKALIIDYFAYWVVENMRNEKNFHEGRYWVFNSASALSEKFHYISRRTMNQKLQELEADGILISGNFNKNKFDRTKWYSFKDEYAWLLDEHRSSAEIAASSGDNLQSIGESSHSIGENCQWSGENCHSIKISNTYTDKNSKKFQTDSSLSLANAREAKKQEAFKIPSFINPEIWKDFEAMRKQIRKPMSERAKKLIVAKLQSLGEDKANEILEQSIVNCWQDVYPLKTDRSSDKEDEYADVPMFASDNPILKNNFLSRDMSVIYDKATQIAIEDERLRSSPAQIEMKDHR
jgi:hypothetical protein